MEDNRHAAPCCALAALRAQMGRIPYHHDAHRSPGDHPLPSLACNPLPATWHKKSDLTAHERQGEKAEGEAGEEATKTDIAQQRRPLLIHPKTECHPPADHPHHRCDQRSNRQIGEKTLVLHR
uniref:Uncharacterized protein n=1 Tax=Magnetococcus massalia (strain MO-1) TaxID=451514 RepID=A0A1S7LHL8_MAGMO|nr:protein of unknown function [Candidatus Magnetococcus massalia]